LPFDLPPLRRLTFDPKFPLECGKDQEAIEEGVQKRKSSRREEPEIPKGMEALASSQPLACVV
jgi:hypothetical protein